MRYRLTILQRLNFVVLLVLFIQLSLSISPVLGQDITIGTQVWTSKNLDVSTFRNGEPIPEAKNAKQWAEASEKRTAAFCYYDFDSENGKVYGKLYNWYAVNDSRGLAPKGYHIPSDAEWQILTDKLGGEDLAGEKLKSKQGWMKICPDCADWTESYRNQVPCHTCKNSQAVKTTEIIKTGGEKYSGFNAVAGGEWANNIKFFMGMSRGGSWWSSSEEFNRSDDAWKRSLLFSHKKVGRWTYNKSYGFSVRCLRD